MRMANLEFENPMNHETDLLSRFNPMLNSDRRSFLRKTALAAAAASIPLVHSQASTTQTQPDGFFTLQKRAARYWLITPKGKPFFSLGLNHVDPATLRYSENVSRWREDYGNSMRRWLQESVRPNLIDWGFNSLGWSQEVVTRGKTNHRHSRHFTREEYGWLDMPYCHQLPFADFHQWEAETKHADFYSDEFADWCDHVAREHCVPLMDDPKLIGYFYIDCPCWLHTQPINVWKGPIFDPKRLDSAAGKQELRELATQYYKVAHDAIRRYDPHHLILGDRYEANALLAIDILEAARPYVDVLSFQDFKLPVEHLEQWHRDTAIPVLWADGAKNLTLPDGNLRQNGRWYAEVLAGLRNNPGCIGAHLCGAYYRNRVRRRGLLDENEQPDVEMIALIREANQVTSAWVESF